MSAQEFEAGWWGSCANTYGEETKQTLYAERMGLELRDVGAPGPYIDIGGRSVVDLGGGPVSLLLKTENAGARMVVDPCPYPSWIERRYRAAGIKYMRYRAEDFNCSAYGEAWIYNVLQHVDDPEQVVRNARQAGVLRIFEWIEVPAHEGHPHELHAGTLDYWCGGIGTVERVDSRGCVGLAWYGVF